MKKSVYTLFLLLILLFSFAPKEKCSAQGVEPAFYIMKRTNKSGESVLTYAFPVNSTFMTQNFSDDEVLKYKFFLISYVGALAQKHKEKEIDGVKVGDVTYFEDVDGLGFSIFFANVEKQKEFFGASQRDKSANERVIKKGVFLQKVIFEIEFPIKDKESAEGFWSVCLLAVDAWAKECNISSAMKEKVVQNLQKSNFVYDFSTENGVYLSKQMYKENGFTHNVFSKSVEEIEKDNIIRFYVQGVNKANVYLFVTFLTCLGMFLAIIIIKTKEKAKK